MRAKKYTCVIIALIVAVIVSVAFFGLDFGPLKIKGADEIRFGIDIRGGVEAVYAPKDLDRAPTSEEMEAARAVIENRMDTQNILDRDVTVDKSTGQILVRFPWKSDETDFNPQNAIAELGETARLTFRDPDGNIVVEGKDVKKSTPNVDPQTNQPVVQLEFNTEGAKAFEEATGRLVNQRISIYMDETLLSAPNVQQKISGGSAVITGMESSEAAKELSDKINSGALPFSLVSKNHSTISPT